MNFFTFDQQEFSVEKKNNTLHLNLGDKSLHLTLLEEGDRCLVSGNLPKDVLSHHAFEFIFNSQLTLKEIQVEGDQFWKISREEFYQTANVWHAQEPIVPEVWNRTAERPHPVRTNRKDGLFYQRYSPVINKTISFRGIDPVSDLDTFHNWHNQPRVAFFWELAIGKKEIQDYMIKTKADPHMVPTFVEMNGVPVGYFEMYWTREDRLGPYYESDAYDRGLHFLIGNKDALGFDNTDQIVKSALHYLFLDDPRTRRVMAEPRHDNKKVLRYAESSGWKKLKEFDFPHKRAALLECKRENFFNGDRL